MVNPKISIIVPIYNAEKCISHCVESILAQTFTDFEVLLINDGSKDRSGNICDEYGRMDGRVRVFHQENGGVSKARNIGLNNAKGEWVTFADSDDWLECDAFEHYVTYINICSFDYFCLGYFLNEKYVKMIGEGVVSVKELLESNNCDKLWNGVYKRNIISSNHIKFDENIRLAEDRLFNYKYLRHCRNAYIASDSYYHYVFGNSNSLSFIGFGIDNFLECNILMYYELRTIVPPKADSLFINAFKGIVWQAICEKWTLLQLMSLYDKVTQRNISLSHILFKYKCIFIAYCILQSLKYKIR